MIHMSPDTEPKKAVKPKKNKEVTEEVIESCSICASNYTPILRRKNTCKYCKADTCSKCIERYLLERHEDAHCLHCRVNYNDSTLSEICTKTYIQQVYFKHRQSVLINRERANLPALQEMAADEQYRRETNATIHNIKREISELEKEHHTLSVLYNGLYVEYIASLKLKGVDVIAKKKVDDTYSNMRDVKHKINMKWEDINTIQHVQHLRRTTNRDNEESDDKKKFIRKCTRDDCQGFLSTAWKCGICEFYSCSKCFKTKTKKQDDPHECTKDDLETAELIKKDCKNCPKCGVFIMKTEGCDLMWCISCQTPFSWNTGKIVVNGPIHNPHYYEWLRRNGDATPRNPADVPCGGFPNAWELRRFPSRISLGIASKFYDFHRICMEIQDVTTRTYRSHIDNTKTNTINVNFLLGDYNEKRWGQLLAKNERKRKFDTEIQEIFGAFRMVAVELINRFQNYRGANNGTVTFSTAQEVIDLIESIDVEVQNLITIINEALQKLGNYYKYSVPQIYSNNNLIVNRYNIPERKYTVCWKTTSSKNSKKTNKIIEPDTTETSDEDTSDIESVEELDEVDEHDTVIQEVIIASLKK
jgi:hypothetical protein